MAAQALGVPAVIVMPTTAPAVKVDGVRGYGAEVIFEGTTSIDRQRRAEAEAAARGLSMIPPFDHPMIIAGQGTVGLELLEQVPGRGHGRTCRWAAAASSPACRRRSSRRGRTVRVVGVEPRGRRQDARRARRRPAGDARAASSSIADGLMNLRAGQITFAHVQRYVDEVVAVPDEAIAAAVALALPDARLVVEPSGAATTAAVTLGLGQPAGTVAAIVSGGNVAAGEVREVHHARAGG